MLNIGWPSFRGIGRFASLHSADVDERTNERTDGRTGLSSVDECDGDENENDDGTDEGVGDAPDAGRGGTECVSRPPFVYENEPTVRVDEALREVDEPNRTTDDANPVSLSSASVGLDELRRRKRAIEATIESGARDCEALCGRIREIEARMERDGALAERYERLIRDGEASLDRILESSEFLAETLARETRALFDDAEV